MEHAYRVALTACGWCVCRCGSEQCGGCVRLARFGSQHVSPAQQRCHGSDLKALPSPPSPARLPCKLGTAVTVSPSNPCVHRGRRTSFLQGRSEHLTAACCLAQGLWISQGKGSCVVHWLAHCPWGLVWFCL